MLVQLEKGYGSSPKLFKFFNYWSKHTAFLAIVKESWMEPMSGSPIKVLHRKLKRLKQRLKVFDREMFFDLSMRVKAKRVELDRVQEEVLRQPRADLVQLEKKLSMELYELMQAEEGFYKQKSRIQWLREGDANTNFFHKFVAVSQSRSTITTLIDSDGNKISSHPELAKEAVSFF